MPFNTIVCVKQVPDPECFQHIEIDPVTNTINRGALPAVINPLDKHALEAALLLRDRYGGQIAAVSMGPPEAEAVLRESLAVGVDKAFLVSDKACAGSDTLATAYVLAKAIQTIGRPNVVFCGNETVDGGTAQVGPQLAEFLDMPHVTSVRKLDVVNKNTVRVERAIERGYMVVEAQLPAVLAVTRESNQPRYLTPLGILEAESKAVTMWTCADIDADRTRVGLTGSPTCISTVFRPGLHRAGVILRGDPEDVARQLVDRLRNMGAPLG